ncbi:MAG: aminotransferase class I/II-fold pyridoxal phosphate-dependent enzyme, partial [Solirubrobacteraceae bacterium]
MWPIRPAAAGFATTSPPGRPDVAAFPRAAWLSAARRALATAPAETLDYSDPRGLPDLREAIAAYLARMRGVRANPERVVICGGFTQGWALLCDVLAHSGAKTVAMEVHGVQHHRRIAARRDLEILNLAVDDAGAVIKPGGGAAMLVTAAHQFPLGVALAPQRRADAVRWAQAQSCLVIEDDFDGEFRYDRQPIGAMQALAPEHVVYAGTASKSLAPGLRL